MRLLGLIVVIAAGSVNAATLERLSLPDLIDKSTEIVRGKIAACVAEYRGQILYTTCRVNVTERWKGTARAAVRVSVPGGVMNGLRQMFAGAPQLRDGEEHVLFLWTGKSAMTHVIGLSQGLFHIERSAQGALDAVRVPTTETMIDPSTGMSMRDAGLRLPLDDLRDRVRQRTAGGAIR